MDRKDLIRHSLTLTQHVVDSYLGDLSDADLLHVPVEGMNPIAWQLGHLISSERFMAEGAKPGGSPELPAGFVEAHPRDPKAFDPSKALPRAEYQRLMAAQRVATLTALDAITDEELDSPSPDSAQRMAPTKGDLLNMVGMHLSMHMGQWVAVRRSLGKPVTI